IDDFHKILMDFISIIQETEDLHASVQNDWLDAAVEILATIVDVLITRGEFTANRVLLEEALDELIAYAQDELIVELKALVVEQIPAGPYKPLITSMMYTCLDAEFEDWSPVMEAAQDLALHLAKREIIELLADNIVDALFEDIELDTPMEAAVAGYVRSVLEAATNEEGFDDFDAALEQFGQDIGQQVLQQGADNREEVVAAVESVFGKIESELPQGAFRDFVVGMTKDLALQAIPTVENGSMNHSIDSDAVVKILVRHALYNVVLKDYYAEEVTAGLYQTLYRAQAYTPEGEDRGDYETAMHRDFRDFRGDLVVPLQDTAWNALSLQNDINEWARALDALGDILESLSIPLEFFATFYPPMEDTADTVSDFVDVLDGMQIATRAIEFGLKLDCLDTLAGRAEPFYETIFPTPAQSVYRMGVTPLEHDFGETREAGSIMACPVTIWNAGNQPLHISGITLGDTSNFAFAPNTETLTPTIPPGHSHTVYVEFEPTYSGPFETVLTVHCGATNPPQQSITLKGLGAHIDAGIVGDVDGDNVVNAVDIQLVINSVLGLPGHGFPDVNHDKRVDARDIQLVINVVLGLPVNI
ncbi:MAG: dockerin type I domain-containing protein, partial [Candidatus Hydrogenedentota bacterium]